jgi:hypothetical protein
MELENIILSEVSQVQKGIGHMFSVSVRQAQHKYKQNYIYRGIYTELASKSGTGRDQERRKRKEDS